jgi:O-antigen/teichoic acid export membrane protein
VWTWVLMIGALSDFGLSSAARRFIPEYTELKSIDRLRGFLSGSRWLAFGVATAIGALGAIGVTVIAPWLDHFAVMPLYLACVTIPIYGLVQVQAGIAQTYNWSSLALMPFYIWRQFTITALMGAAYLFGTPTGAVTAMIVAVVTTWAVTLGQLFMLDRRLKQTVPAGPKKYEPKVWFATSAPIFVAEAFYLLLTYVDILALEHLRSPDEVAVYYAGAPVGPAERLLNMLGERKQCTFIYAAAFAINLVLCVILIPRIGIEGAGIATSSALVVESIMLYLVTKRRLGFHVFIMGGASGA